jgi:hypothetical protein
MIFSIITCSPGDRKAGIAPPTDHRAQWTDHNAQWTDHNAQWTDHNAQWTDHNAQGIDHNAQGIDHNAQGIDHNAQWTDNNAQWIDHNAQWIDHNAQWTNGEIFPDYSGVTVPVNIAPLNFSIKTKQKAVAVFRYNDYSFTVSSNGEGNFTIPVRKWQMLLSLSKGDRFEVNVTIRGAEYKSFGINVAPEPVDDYIAYRLIEPGYVVWNRMGIYQRELGTYRQSAVYENRLTDNNCVNCHSFCRHNPDRMLLHFRAKHAGTVIIDGNDIEVLDTKTDKTISPLVYPSWHPSGRFVAFSVNNTRQIIHQQQRVEVFDTESDVVVYDVRKKTILTAPQIFSESDLETFPTFSADGRRLYFCSAPRCAIPDSTQHLKYSLCSIAFDPATATFGSQVDTLFGGERRNGSIPAHEHSYSVSFPRISPDGRFLICTVSSYGTFPIWHRDADLYLIDLASGEGRFLDNANSDDAESYHSWSSNSRWLVFSSRRLDGLYTRPYFVYINERGEAAKPFLLPQKSPEMYYAALLKSYNIPEFVTGKIPLKGYVVAKKAKDEKEKRKIKFELLKNNKL